MPYVGSLRGYLCDPPDSPSAEIERQVAQMQHQKKKATDKDEDEEDRIALGAAGAFDTNVYGGKDRFAGYRCVFGGDTHN